MTMDVLVVERSPISRMRLCQLVAGVAGVDRIRQAESRTDALRHIEKRPPDLVLLDVSPGDRASLDLIDELRGPEPPAVIVVTDDSTEKNRRQCVAAGAERFLPRSDLGAIESAVRSWNDRIELRA